MRKATSTMMGDVLAGTAVIAITILTILFFYRISLF